MGARMRWAAGAAVLVVAAGSCKKKETCYELSDGRCVAETYVDPPVLEPDADGVYHLTLAPTEVTIDGQRHCVRAYNGSFVGPTIDTAARDGSARRSVRVDVVNTLIGHDYQSLSGDRCTCVDGDGDACVPEHVHNPCFDGVEDDCTCTNDDGDVCEHMFDFNVTNLHGHGSHTWPDYARGGEGCTQDLVDGRMVDCRECGPDVCDGDASDDACFHGDDVLNAIHPGRGARYRWDLDEDDTHHAGLQWYHPHIHGTTAIQVASGAAGAWIVRGEVDALPGIAQARERVMVFSTPPIANDNGFQPLAEGQTCSEATLTFNDFHALSSTSAAQTNVVNGVRRPRIVTPPGQVERWRIVHAGFLDEVYFGLFRGSDLDCSDFSTAEADRIEVTQIGRDGLLLPQAFAYPYVFMSPGYRVEAMVGGDRFADGDTWCLVAARFLQDHTGPGDGFFEQPMAPAEPPTLADVLARFDTDGDVVAIVNVAASAGEASETEWPDYTAVAALSEDLDLDGVDIDDRCEAVAAISDPAQIDQAATLQVGFWTADDPDPCGCEPYNVNCSNIEYVDRDRYPYDRDLMLGAVEHWRVEASVDGHPFHIHINPFIACPSDNPFDPMPFPHWRDTYLVNADRKVDLIARNETFTGPFVFHCHKLTHEDDGMMELVRICDPDADASCGDYAWDACDPDDLTCAQALAATECSMNAITPIDAAACVTVLGGPGGVCGPNACGTDGECGLGAICTDHLCAPGCRDDDGCAPTHACSAGQCVPAPCPGPCGPGASCVHGTCE